MRLLNIVSDSSGTASSIQHVHREIALQLQRRGISVETLLLCGGDLGGLGLSLGNEFSTLRRPRRHPIRFRRLSRQLLAVIHSGNYDAVILDGVLSANVLLALENKLPRALSCMLVVHGNVRLEKRRLPSLYRAIRRGFSTRWNFVAVSEDSAQLLGQQFHTEPPPVTVIENCVDESEIQGGMLPRAEAAATLGIDGERFIVGAIGRLSKEKDYGTLLTAFSTLNNPDALLLLIGDGQQRVALEAQARELGIAGNVVFAGWVEQASRYLSLFDVFVMSSITEGSPIALIEAMAAGRAVLVSRIPPLLSVVGERAPTFEVGDPAALCNALRDSALATPQSRALVGEQMKAIVSARLSREVFAEKYYLLVSSIVEVRRAAGGLDAAG